VFWLELFSMYASPFLKTTRTRHPFSTFHVKRSHPSSILISTVLVFAWTSSLHSSDVLMSVQDGALLIPSVHCSCSSKASCLNLIQPSRTMAELTAAATVQTGSAGFGKRLTALFAKTVAIAVGLHSHICRPHCHPRGKIKHR